MGTNAKVVTINDPEATGNILVSQLNNKRGRNGSFPKRLGQLSLGTVLNNRLQVYKNRTDFENGVISGHIVRKATWDSIVSGVSTDAPTTSVLQISEDEFARSILGWIDEVNGTSSIASTSDNGTIPSRVKNNGTRATIKSFSGVVPATPFNFDVGERIETLTKLDQVFDVALGTDLDFSDSDPDTLTRQAGSFVTDGAADGNIVDIASATNPANDGSYTIGTSGVAALVLTLKATDSVTTAVADATATMNIHLTSPDNTTGIADGLIGFAAKDEADAISGTYRVTINRLIEIVQTRGVASPVVDAVFVSNPHWVLINSL